MISPATSTSFQTNADKDFLKKMTSGTIVAQKIIIIVADRLMLVKGILPKRRKKNNWSMTNGASVIAPKITIKQTPNFLIDLTVTNKR